MTMVELRKRVEALSALIASDDSRLPAGLSIYRSDHPTKLDAMIYDPIVCLIVQGAKETTIGDETVLLEKGQCVIVGHDLPVLAQITKATPRTPYLALIIRLDLELIRTLDDTLDEFEVDADGARSLEVATVPAPIVEVLKRYLALAEDPLDAKVLLPLVKKELHFRLLRSESGTMLRALANRQSHASNIDRAIRQLRKHYRRNLDISELAKSVGMSPSSFHKHFKSMTRTTPLQFQKDLRLTEARRLLRIGANTVSGSAFEVGYESASQFSREYSRKFGSPPRSDAQVA